MLLLFNILLGAIACQVNKFMANHRKPPKPIHWNVPRGQCRYCGEEIIENGKRNNRKHWHSKCVSIWNTMNNPTYARRAIHKRDKYTCVSCGYHDRFGHFDVDHIKPLFEANGDPSYWQADNLRLLCSDCHKEKTREDMARFHEARRKEKRN